LLFIYKSLIRESYSGQIKENQYLLLLFFGFIPVSLIYIRPESQFLIYLLIAIYIYIFSLKRIVRSSLVAWIYPIIFSVLINLHGRGIFLLPLFAYMVLTVRLSENRINWASLLPLVAMIWVGYESFATYNALYSCPEDAGVVEILNSLRFNTELLNANVGEIFRDLISRHVDSLAILKGAVFFNPQGAFPLPHKDFPVLVNVVFMAVKLVLLGGLLISICNLFFITINFNKLKNINNGGRKSGLIFFLILFLYLDVILMKPDRFYESSIFWPILLLLIVMQFDLLRSIKSQISDNVIRALGKTILFLFYIMSIVFLVTYGKDLVLKSWAGPYVSIRKHNVELYDKAINSAANDADINIKTAKLVLADFHTIHYTAAGDYPIMINLFWWFSEKTTSEYMDGFGRIKLLSKLGSDGFIVRCDSVPPAIQSQANQYVIDHSEPEAPINKICSISKQQMKKINYSDYLVIK
jgi:hypothetical protein